MSTLFLVGSGIGNQAQTIPAFYLAKTRYPDITVVNTEPYNIDTTRMLFRGLADVFTEEEIAPRLGEFNRQIQTFFSNRSFLGITRALNRRPVPGESEVEHNMLSTGLPHSVADMSVVGDCLDYIEPQQDVPDVIIHDGYNKNSVEPEYGEDKWLAKSYLHWQWVAELLMMRGLRVGSIGSESEHVEGTEDLTGLPIEQSVAVMKGSRVVLSNDTGSYHLCNLIGRENVVVFTMTSLIKNNDPRFHRYSTVVSSMMPCAPCQDIGNSFWYHNRHKCHWACRGDTDPKEVVHQAMTLL